MSSETDPFSHHPELRGKITDPLQSYFRTFNAQIEMGKRPELRWVLELLHSDEEREASRLQTLRDHRHEDLWIFAYGSLMWDPAFIFSEVRHAMVADHARRLILKDVWGARGTTEAPGLMAALDIGPGCDGLVFRIARERVDTETDILWRREMVGPGYKPAFVTARIGSEPVSALTFVADHDTDTMQPDLTWDEQVRFIATGVGFLGTSLDYLRNIVSQFAALGIVDADCSALLRDAEAYALAHPTPSGATA